MNRPSLPLSAAALALAAVLAGATATSVAQSGRSRTTDPQRNIQAEPDRSDQTAVSRDLRDLIDELENSTPDEVRSGRIGRFFTDPAVIITNGRMHRVDWFRIRDDRPDDRDRPNDAPRDTQDRNNQLDRRPTNVRIEGLQSRRIDPRTVVVLYTAVIPQEDGVFRQPVVATLVRESGSSGWRVASYTAENAAIPGGADQDNVEDNQPLP